VAARASSRRFIVRLFARMRSLERFKRLPRRAGKRAGTLQGADEARLTTRSINKADGERTVTIKVQENTSQQKSLPPRAGVGAKARGVNRSVCRLTVHLA
jgi:hypothetical protein